MLFFETNPSKMERCNCSFIPSCWRPSLFKCASTVPSIYWSWKDWTYLPSFNVINACPTSSTLICNKPKKMSNGQLFQINRVWVISSHHEFWIVQHKATWSLTHSSKSRALNHHFLLHQSWRIIIFWQLSNWLWRWRPSIVLNLPSSGKKTAQCTDCLQSFLLNAELHGNKLMHHHQKVVWLLGTMQTTARDAWKIAVVSPISFLPRIEGEIWWVHHFVPLHVQNPSLFLAGVLHEPHEDTLTSQVLRGILAVFHLVSNQSTNWDAIFRIDLGFQLVRESCEVPYDRYSNCCCLA